MKKVGLLLMMWQMSLLFANPGGLSIVDRMPNLVMQLGIIIFAARIGAIIFEKLKIPGVLGELVVGIIIGPYMLGSISCIGFPHGIFGSENSVFPVQPELYGIAIIASVILLFLAGLETDIAMFIRFSFAGTVIGIGGIIFSFFIGAYTASFFLNASVFAPKCMFMGIMSTATSVGITARILSERKKIDSPEGVTIIAGAVIDDILGVVLLAVVLGVSIMLESGHSDSFNWKNIGLIAVKEIGIWLGVTLAGLYFARKIGGLLKKFRSHIVFSVVAFSFALIIAGLFERAGLAMIIGAYVVGFTLSKTEISYTIQEALHPLKVFFVPVFFTVMGMLVNVQALLSPKTLIFGLIYTLGAILAKMLGSGLPALFLNFNLTGAKRIGLGMIPRGEVALVIAGIGLSYGFLDDPNYDIFGIAIFMTLITTLISPPLLNYSLKSGKSGVKDTVQIPLKSYFELNLGDSDLCELINHKILGQFKALGFFISRPDPDCYSFQIRKDLTNITLTRSDKSISLQSDKESELFVRRVVYEAAFLLKNTLNNVIDLDSHPQLSESGSMSEHLSHLSDLIQDNNILFIHADNRDDFIWQMITFLKNNGKIEDEKSLYYSTIARENILSGGLVNGLAIPHTRTDEQVDPLIVIGISHKGIEFNAIDRAVTHLVVLIITSYADADLHIRLLSKFAGWGRKKEMIDYIRNETDVSLIRQMLISNSR